MANTGIAVGITYRELGRCPNALLSQNIKQTFFSTHHILFNDYPHCTEEASERLNLNNVAKVERKESLLTLPRPSNVSKKRCES